MSIFKKIKLINNKYLKYLLLFTVLFFIFLALLTAWSIFISFNLFKYESVRNSPPITTVEFVANSNGEIEVDIENNESVYPTKEDYEKIGTLEEVKSYEINLLDIYLSPNLLDVSDEKFSELGLFSIKGISDSAIFDEELNNIKISDGRMINNDEIRNGVNSVLISEEVAKKNNLKVGDDFLLQISNLNDTKEIYEQVIQVVGIFKPDGKIGSESIDSQNLSVILEDLLKHDQEEEHDHEHDHEVDHNAEQSDDSKLISQTEFDNIKSLQKTLLLENLNTIYMSNNAVEMISKKVDKKFNNDIPSTNYQASYILNSPDKVNEFKSKAENILPKYFTIYGINDAYRLWMPSTTQNMMIINFVVFFMLILSMIILILLTVTASFKNKGLLFQYLFLGKVYNDFFKVFFKKCVILVSIAVFTAMILAPVLSRKIISEYLTSSGINSGMYLNIQNLSRNLIDMSINLTDYATFNKEYIIGSFILYIVSILLVGTTLHITKKRLLRGVLV